jgi:hypothetical protein
MPPLRSWQETLKNSKDLWKTSKIDTKKEFERKSQIYGLKDSIMNKLIDTKKGKDVAERERIIKMEKDTPDRVYNPFIHLMAFDGGQDAPIESLHVFLLGIVKYLWKDFMSHLKENQLRELVARWAAFNSEGLHIPPIQPRYMVVHYASLIGKEYRLVLQAAPFVLFPLMTNEQKEVWTPLCHIGSLVFEKNIKNMQDYILKLDQHIDTFLYHIAKMSARWVNKPKFHHLKHLSKSIERFGNARLFATERFESYNGVIRQSSIHSNRQAPGRDIATSFRDYSIMRLLLSGAHLYDHERKIYFQSSPYITDFFMNTPLLQNSMGFHNISSHSDYQRPEIHGKRKKPMDENEIPYPLAQRFTSYEIMRISSIRIDGKDIVRPGTFVLVRITSLNEYIL